MQCWYCDWQGARRRKTKRGFAAHSAGAIDMRFGDFFDIYTEDVKPRLKINTWLSKEHMVRTKWFSQEYLLSLRMPSLPA